MKTWENVTVEVDADRIAWVTLNRPHKRNAMSPALNNDMVEVLNELEVDEGAGVIVLTGAGDSWSAGMDLKEFFREVDSLPPAAAMQARRSAGQWQWRMLMNYVKPTIAMVNGWCFGGAFVPLASCDLAVAADEATFGLSEINWGIIPGGNVTRAVAALISQRDALYYIMSGKTFDGKKAAEMRLVNESVPLARLRERTREIALDLADKNPVVLRTAKTAFKYVQDMPWDTADDYLMAKSAQSRLQDTSGGRSKGLTQFLDEKSYKPGLSNYRRDD
jgi:trans-feruloyl-CoA hydratase/vanillin synthase